MDVERLVRAIQNEHPQAIALVVSQMPPDLAARALAALPAEMRGDIAYRMATAHQANPVAMMSLLQQIRRRIPAIANPPPQAPQAGGVEHLVDMLKQVDAATEQRIIEALDDQNPDVAEAIRRSQFTFDDIATLADRDVQRLWRELRQDQVVVALRGVTGPVLDKLLKNLSQRSRAALVQEIELLGPTRVSVIQDAQREIVQLVQRLVASGEIAIPRPGEGGARLV